MLFAGADRERVADGSLTVAFRAWAAPRVVAGRTYRTNAGRVVVEEVAVVDPADLTEDDARTAGRSDLAVLLDELERHGRGPLVFRVAFRLAGDPDPRAALAATATLDATRSPRSVLGSTAWTARAVRDRGRAPPWE